MIMNTLWIVLPALTLLMFHLGLGLTLKDFGKAFRHPRPVAVALFGQIVLLPCIAAGLGWLFNLPPTFFIGLVLIACCPGGSSSNVFSKMAGGDVALLSRLSGNSKAQRRTIVIEVGMQNAAQAIAIASSPFIFADDTLAIPAILYSLMMNIILLTYVFIARKR